MKALEVVLALPHQSSLQKQVPRRGGFHLTMCFLGCIGYGMADSGLQEVLSIVYAEKQPNTYFEDTPMLVQYELTT